MSESPLKKIRTFTVTCGQQPGRSGPQTPVALAGQARQGHVQVQVQGGPHVHQLGVEWNAEELGLVKLDNSMQCAEC